MTSQVHRTSASTDATPGRYQAPSGRRYQLRASGTWHLIYRRTGTVSRRPVGPTGPQRGDVTAVLADPAAAATAYTKATGTCACCGAGPITDPATHVCACKRCEAHAT